MSSNFTTQQVWSALGILFVLVGSWFVAYEVVNKFSGVSHKVSTAWGGEGTAEKTETYIRWEARRNVCMWIGLTFMSLGSAMQLVAVLL